MPSIAWNVAERLLIRERTRSSAVTDAACVTITIIIAFCAIIKGW